MNYEIARIFNLKDKYCHHLYAEVTRDGNAFHFHCRECGRIGITDEQDARYFGWIKDGEQCPSLSKTS